MCRACAASVRIAAPMSLRRSPIAQTPSCTATGLQALIFLHSILILVVTVPPGGLPPPLAPGFPRAAGRRFSRSPTFRLFSNYWKSQHFAARAELWNWEAEDPERPWPAASALI